MKKVIFSLGNFVNQKIEFAETQIEGVNGVDITACIFSTACNRNKAYFEITKLLGYQDKLERILHNFNHDLSLTDGKYLGNQTKLTEVWSQQNGNDFEIWAKCKSTDPAFIAQKDNITAPSIELAVDPADIIEDENGRMYFIDFDWQGIAWLLGIPQGSGDARIQQIETFSTNQKDFKNIMQEEQVKELLKAQKVEFTAIIEELTKKIQTFETIAQSIQNEESIFEWTDELGNKYRRTSKEVCSSITELVETGNMQDSQLLSLMSAKFSSNKEDQLDTVEDQDGTNLDAVEEQTNQAFAMAEKMKAIQTDEELVTPNGSANTANAKDFNYELKEIIAKNINN